jgi:hypothetical protein
MATSTRRVGGRGAVPAAAGPLLNAALVAGALGYGIWLLVARGRLSWPPGPLLQGAYTVAGCLALVGPVVLWRRDEGEGGGMGELLWMTGGTLVWLYDAAAILRGQASGHAWATPVGMAPLGVFMLAVLIAGWRTRGAGARAWSWTNVTGWILGGFWIGMGLAALGPARWLGLTAS